MAQPQTFQPNSNGSQQTPSQPQPSVEQPQQIPSQSDFSAKAPTWIKVVSILTLFLVLILGGMVALLFSERQVLKTQLSTIQNDIQDGTIEVVQSDKKLNDLKNTFSTGKAGDLADERLILGKDGKFTLVGVNTKNPTAELHITAVKGEGGDPEILLENATGSQKWLLMSDSSDKSRFVLRNLTDKKDVVSVSASAPANSFFVNDSGFVGFGTSTPSQRLHVNGNIRITGLPESGFATNPVCFDNDGVLRACRD